MGPCLCNAPIPVWHIRYGRPCISNSIRRTRIPLQVWGSSVTTFQHAWEESSSQRRLALRHNERTALGPGWSAQLACTNDRSRRDLAVPRRIGEGRQSTPKSDGAEVNTFGTVRRSEFLRLFCCIRQMQNCTPISHSASCEYPYSNHDPLGHIEGRSTRRRSQSCVVHVGMVRHCGHLLQRLAIREIGCIPVARIP